jgi:hypothetical protein
LSSTAIEEEEEEEEYLYIYIVMFRNKCFLMPHVNKIITVTYVCIITCAR